jgi:hypothetical protein
MIHTSRLLGYTRSKKKICAYSSHDIGFIGQQTSGFSLADHFDAFCVFEFRILEIDDLNKMMATILSEAQLLYFFPFSLYLCPC